MMQLFFSSLKTLTFLSLFIFSLGPETVHSSKCGLKNSPMRGQTRIINGQESKVNEWPWMVSLQVGNQNRCGGAVIGKRWIITTGFCLLQNDGSPRWNTEDIKIYLGDHDLKDASETDKAEVYKVDNFKVHEKWEGEPRLLNDIAVIKVSKSIDLSQHTPVCLPPRNRKYVGSQAMATGWGVESYTDRGVAQYSDVLQEVSLSIRNSSFCKIWERNFGPGQICAGGSGATICGRDGGGPLTVEGRTGRHTLVGVTIGTVQEPCDVNHPGYFVDVSYYRDWIKEKTGI